MNAERDAVVNKIGEKHPMEAQALSAKKKGNGRKKISQKQLELERLRAENNDPEMTELIRIMDYMRPHSRKDCQKGHRPCLFVSCKHHLYLDVNTETGTIKYNFPDISLFEMKETCALDVADRGGITLEEVGEILNLTRERIRQVEVKGLSKLRHHSRKINLKDFFT